ncbi:MAG: cytochrome P450, partial [Myxococcota bacterium]
MNAPASLPPGPPERRGPLDALPYYYRFFRDSIGAVEERFDRYGDIYYAPSDGVGLYVLKHPDHLHDVLAKRAADFGKTHTAFTQLEDFVGRGLLLTDGEEWRRQRRLVNPAFAKKRLVDYAAMMVDEAARATATWYPGQVRDMSREMMELTLRIVCRTLFSHDVTRQSDRVAHAMEAFREALLRPRFLPRWVPFLGEDRSFRARDELDGILMSLVEARRRSPERAPDPPDLLQMLVTAEDGEGGGGLQDREIRDQLLTLFIAGHETTSHALSWTLYLLAKHPEQEAKLHAELDRVLDGRPPRYDDLAALPFTRWCFEEAMRLYPPAYTLARRAERDTKIGDYAVAAGSEVVMWIWHTHRDPKWWPEPTLFRPERFSPRESA